MNAEEDEENIGVVQSALSESGINTADAYVYAVQPIAQSDGYVIGQGGWEPNLHLKSGYKRLEVCVQYYSSGWRSANCASSENLYMPLDAGYSEWAMKRTVSSSTRTCWRTWAWVYSTYTGKGTAVLSPQTCNYRRPS